MPDLFDIAGDLSTPGGDCRQLRPQPAARSRRSRAVDVGSSSTAHPLPWFDAQQEVPNENQTAIRAHDEYVRSL
jgi:hypothetical protein